MTETSPNGNRRSWDYPDCPDCETDILVEIRPDGYAHCLDCGYTWRADDGE